MNDKRYLLEGSAAKAIIKFTLPLFGASIIQRIYSIIDAMIAGRFIGSTALASVGVNNPIMQLSATLFFGFAVGANILISQNFGANNRNAVRKTIDTFMITAYASSVVFFLLAFLLAKPIHTNILKTPIEILPDAIKYMNTVLIGIMAMFGYVGVSASMRATGDTKTPLVLLIVSNVINLLLNLLFVVAFRMGIVGLGLATAISQIIIFIVGVIVVNTKSDMLRIHFVKSKFRFSILKELIHLGYPAILQSLCMTFGAFAIQSIINTFGVQVVAGYNIASRLEMMVLAMTMNFGQALSVFIAQNVGAGQLDRIQDGVRASLAISVGMAIVFCIVIYIFCESILLSFTSDKDIIAQGVKYLRIVVPFYTVCTFTFVLGGGIRGSGATLVPMIITIIGQVVLRIPLAYLFVDLFGTVEALWYAIPTSWISGAILLWIYYKSDKWKKHIRVKLKPRDEECI